MRSTAVRRRGERGLALVLVVVVLVALALLVTPFAVSMHGLQATAQRDFEQERARSGAAAALAVARRHLEDTHPALDRQTPHFDGRDELSGAALTRRFPDLLPRDPRGAIRSVRIEDESGKVPLGNASCFLLGNVLGGRARLVSDASAGADRLLVDSTRGFPPAGLARVGDEVVEFSQRTENSLGEVVRGLPSLSGPTRPTPHAAGTEVLDVRLVRLVQSSWRLDPGRFVRFGQPSDLLRLDRFAESTYGEQDLDRVASLLTVHGAPPDWDASQRVTEIRPSRRGGTELVVEDGAFLGPGSVLRLDGPRGQRAHNLVLSTLPWGRRWRLELLEPPGAWMSGAEVTVRALKREAINVNSAPHAVLVALMAGLSSQPVIDVVTESEAAAVARALVESGSTPDTMSFRVGYGDALQSLGVSTDDLRAVRGVLEQRDLGPRDLPAEELGALLVGAATRAPVERVDRGTAARLAARIARGQPRSHEDLAALLQRAVAEGECLPEQRELVLFNAVHPGDARLHGGTAPFAYASAGVFTLEAGASENASNGRERSRARVREVVTVAPPGRTARLLETQADFEALLGGRGWTSFPRALRTSEPRTDEEARLSRVLSEADRRVDRASAVIAGWRGPSDAAARSYLAPEPVRSALPRTLHFDEGLPGLTADSPRGLSLDRELRLPLDELRPLIVDEEGLLQPFALEMWVEFDDPSGEVVLFDTGVDTLENRVLLMLAGGELVLRVSGGGFADFDARMTDERPPPAGEIRYAFDDGLPLLPGVPYHVLARVGGERDAQLSLFVDGAPRGRRSHTTRLVEDLGPELARTQGSAASFGTTRIRVESTAGFPERGVLRIGRELIEYVSKTENTFVAEAAGSLDTFGGRARRGTFGPAHEASELVELMGYARPLASDIAGQGEGSLRGRLAPFGVAELDPDLASTTLTASMTFFTPAGAITEDVPIGTGIETNDVNLPLRSPTGTSLEGVFQDGGGHAILFCDYGDSQVFSQNYAPPEIDAPPQPLPSQTSSGSFIGGAEVVRYESFDGTWLRGCQRADAGIPISTGPEPSPLNESLGTTYVYEGSAAWEDPRAFITTFGSELVSVIDELPNEARVLVVPISVGIDDPDLAAGFHPGSGPAGSFLERSFLVQLGLDFADDGEATEWVRWTTPTTSALVRDDAEAVENMLNVIAESGIWNPEESDVDDELVESLNEQLAFRGQDGTPDGDHPTGTLALPVHVLGLWGVTNMDPVLGRPGRFDSVTLVGDDGAREAHLVNHASSEDMDWIGFSLVAFRESLVGSFGTTSDEDVAQLPGDEDSRRDAVERVQRTFGLSDRDAAEERVQRVNIDSRRLTRLLKSPTGELPDAPLGEVVLGGQFDGRPTPGATIDELRVHVPSAPGPLVPKFARFVLLEDLEFDEEGTLYLGVEDLHYPHARVHSDILGRDALEVLGSLPPLGGLLLIGEEIVSYAGLDPVDSGAVFLTGRGLYGTERARHPALEPVEPLLFWPATALAAAVDRDASRLKLADPHAFPVGEGLVWVGDELVGFTTVADGALVQPEGELSRGLLRGRFGTEASPHAAGALLRWQPRRVADRALQGHAADAQWLRLRVAAEGALFTELALRVQRDDPAVDLVGRVVLDDGARPAGAPGSLELPGSDAAAGTRVLRLDREAGLLDLYLGARFLPGAFDPVGLGGNGWKSGPRVSVLAVEHVQPSIVREHVEWR